LLRGRHFEFLHPRTGCIIRLRSGRDPLANHLVLDAIGAKPNAATVLGLPGRLAEDQARARVVEVHAPAGELAQDAVVIAGGIGPEEREPEAVLSLHRAVAHARVAAELAEERGDVPLIRWRLLRGADEARQRESENSSGNESGHHLSFSN